MAGSIKFYKECHKQNIKPILGMEAYMTLNLDEQIRDNYHIILLAKNKTGWLNLIKLHNVSYYNFYLSDKMANDLSSARTENHNSIYVITRSIEGKTKDEALDLIRLYVKNNGGYITIKDSSGNTIYTNSKDTSKIFSTTTMISIDGDNYELTYSKISVAPGIKIFRNC